MNDPSIIDIQVKWEWIKFKVRDFSISYAKRKCKERRDKISDLTNRLNGLEKCLANDPNEDILHDIDVVKHQIEELDSKIVDGIIIRARSRWAEKGEKSNKYFLGLEKRNGIKKQCKKLILDNGDEITNSRDILRMHANFL